MKTTLYLLFIMLFSTHVEAQNLNDSISERESLDNATAAIRDGFKKGDATLAAKLHSPDIIKCFGGNNVVIG
jgi:hypothetical protein